MKKIVYILSVALAAAACSKTENPANTPEVLDPQTGKVEFTASFGEVPEMKSELSGTSVLWKEGDEISILWNGGNTTAQADKAGAQANFSATVSDASEYFAVYPSSASVSLSEGALSVGIPAEQNGLFEDANIAIARTAGRNLVFKNLCALGQITLTRNDIAKIVFKGKGQQSLAGDATLSLDNEGVPTVSLVANAATDIVLTPESGDTFAAGTYYFAAIPGTLSNGVEFTLTTVTGNTVFGNASANEAVLTRSKALNFGMLDAAGTATTLTLTFDFRSNALTDWPTEAQASNTLKNKEVIYPLDGTDYTFALRFPTSTSTTKYGIYWGTNDYGTRFTINGRFKYAGIPAISGYRLVTAKLWQMRVGASDKTSKPAVAISDQVPEEIPAASSDMSLATGGEYQVWEAGLASNTLGGPYTYNLSDTVAGNNYYMVIYYTTENSPSKVAGIGKMEFTYEKVTQLNDDTEII